MKKYIWFLLLIIVIVGVLIYYKNQTNSTPKNDPGDIFTSDVDTTKNNPGDVFTPDVYTTRNDGTDYFACIKNGGQLGHEMESSTCEINGEKYYSPVPKGAID